MLLTKADFGKPSPSIFANFLSPPTRMPISGIIDASEVTAVGLLMPITPTAALNLADHRKPETCEVDSISLRPKLPQVALR
jgi:hypothetical protein